MRLHVTRHKSASLALRWRCLGPLLVISRSVTHRAVSRCSRFSPFARGKSMEEILIESVRSHPVLFNLNSPSYMDHKLRQEAWDEIGRELKISAENAKEKWNKLRRCFCNAMNRRRNKRSGEAAKKIIPWKFEQQMSFLLPFLEVRTTHSSMDDHKPQVCQYSDIEPESIEDNGRIGMEYNEDDYENGEIAEHATATEETEIFKKIRANRRAKSRLHNTVSEMVEIMKENVNLRRAKYEKSLEPNFFSTIDETDMFFLSMARMTKKLPKHEQSKIKLTLSNTVLRAEIQNQLKQNAFCSEEQDTPSRQESSSSNHTPYVPSANTLPKQI